MCKNFETEKPEEIEDKFNQKTLENQSIVNMFNQLARSIFELKITKENLLTELK